MDAEFTPEDFRKHIDNIQKMGMKKMICRMPGLAETVREGEDPDVALLRVKRILDAMTLEERVNPDLIDDSRRVRIAAAAGAQPHDVSDLLKRFEKVRALMKDMMNMSLWQRIKLVLGLGRWPLPPAPPRPGA